MGDMTARGEAAKASESSPTPAMAEKAAYEKANATTPAMDDKAASDEAHTSSSSRTASVQDRKGARHVQTVDADLSEKVRDDRVILTEDDCYDELGFSFPTWKKWTILSVIFLVQVSMNLNTSLYSNGIGGISSDYNVSPQAARCGAMIFLVLYAFGCELWAPWSEELGRKPILQLSLLLVNIWQLPVALAPNFGSIMAGRALGGLSSAGGSVTLGMVADMWESDTQQYAVAFVVFSSVGGSIVGPVIGGPVEQYLPWQWTIWLQLIFGVTVQVMHLILVPETRTTIMMDRIAKKRRANGENVWGPNELVPFKSRFSAREILVTWIRPFKMFVTEPIVLTLSLLSGFSDALIFMFIQSFSLVYAQWQFSPTQLGLAFLPIGIGYVIAYLSFIPAIRRNIRERAAKPDDERAQYESRLWWLLWTAPCLPIGLFGFAWTSGGAVVNNPNGWIASMIFAAVVGIANYSIYMATIDFMIAAYGPYSASATGGNGWARDFLAGVLTIPATPFFQNIGGARHLEYASTILACISFVLVIAVYVVYWKGPVLRKRSPFAQHLAQARSGGGKADKEGLAVGAPHAAQRPMGSRRSSQARLDQDLRVRPAMASRGNTPAGSRSNTPAASRRGSLDT